MEEGRGALTGGCRCGEAAGGLASRGASYGIGWGTRFRFLWLVPSFKQGQTLENLPGISQVLACVESIIPEVTVWLPGLVARDSSLTSYKSDLQMAGWLAGVAAVRDGLASRVVCCRLWVRVRLVQYCLAIVILYSLSNLTKKDVRSRNSGTKSGVP